MPCRLYNCSPVLLAIGYILLASSCRQSGTAPAEGTADARVEQPTQSGNETQSAAVPELSRGEREAVTQVQRALREVDPRPLAQWLEDVRNHPIPWLEIEQLQQTAQTYGWYTAPRSLSRKEKREVFRVVQLCPNGTEAMFLRALPEARLERLSRNEALKIKRYFDRTPGRHLVVH